jgi:hypothetical protein
MVSSFSLFKISGVSFRIPDEIKKFKFSNPIFVLFVLPLSNILHYSVKIAQIWNGNLQYQEFYSAGSSRSILPTMRPHALRHQASTCHKVNFWEQILHLILTYKTALSCFWWHLQVVKRYQNNFTIIYFWDIWCSALTLSSIQIIFFFFLTNDCWPWLSHTWPTNWIETISRVWLCLCF